MTHTVNGITYERIGDGDIRVSVTPGGFFPQVMTSDQWIELVAAMSANKGKLAYEWVKNLHEIDIGDEDADL